MQSIVVGIDGSPDAGRAVQQAADLARAIGARLHLVNAYYGDPGERERAGSTAETDGGDRRRAAEHLLRRAASEIGRRGVADVQTHAREGDPVDVIAGVAEEERAQLIVVGERGLSTVKRWLLGSVSDRLATTRPATC